MNHFTHSLALLREPFQPGEAGFDKVFLLARVDIAQDLVTLSIDADTPTVLLNEKTREALGVSGSIATVADMQARYGHSPYMLISGGIFLWTMLPEQAPRAILLQTDKGAKGAGQWKEPAGRCDRYPSATITNEGQEELLVLMRRAADEKFRPVVLADSDYGQDSSLNLKRAQMTQARLTGAGLSETEVARHSAWPATRKEMPHEDGLYRKVNVKAAGQLCESFAAICLTVEAHNTLELRRSYVVTLQEGDQIVAMDGEDFARKTGDFSLEEMQRLRSEGKFTPRPALGLYMDSTGPSA